MDTLTARLLSEIVDRYDSHDRPLTRTELARCLDSEDIGECLAELTDYELVVPVDEDCYRPTVTARELLELDLADDDVVVIDCPDDQE